MNLAIKTKNDAADPEIRFPKKSILQAFGLTRRCREPGG